MYWLCIDEYVILWILLITLYMCRSSSDADSELHDQVDVLENYIRYRTNLFSTPYKGNFMEVLVFMKEPVIVKLKYCTVFH